MKDNLKTESIPARNLRFDFASMIFCYMVIMIHSSYASFYHATGTVEVFLNDYYTDYFSGFAVPAFFIMSAMKFYKSYDYNKTIYKYKSRVRSLLIPYLCWNFLSLIWIIALSYLPVISSFVTGREKFSFNITNILGGLFWFKYIHPFWYMAMLMIFTLLCPLIYAIIKNKYVGWAVILCLYIIDALPIEFPATTWPMFQWRTIVYSLAFYLIGAMIGRYGYEKACTKPDSKFKLPCVAAFGLSILIRAITNNSDILFIPSILLGFMSIWLLSGMKDIKHEEMVTLSFFIYPAHTFVLPVVNKLLFLVLPRVEWMSIVNTVLGTFLTFVICIILGVALRKILPVKVWMALNGGRV